MAITQDKTGGIIIAGYEQGIQPSPHKGLANIQNGNIATETGEVMASFGRTQVSMTSTAAIGTLAFQDTSHVALSIGSSNNHFKGMWINVSASSHPGELANGNYWVVQSSPGGTYNLTQTYGGSGLTGFTSGLTATITLVRTMGKALASATEQYFSSGTAYNRYYVLDHQGLIWMYDTFYDDPFYDNDDVRYWVLPDISISYWSPDATPSGFVVINGTLMVFSGNKIWVKPTPTLGASYTQMTNALLMSSASSTNPHYGFYGHQGYAYYTDGSFIGSIFPNTSLLTNVANVQSYASYSGASTTGTIVNLYSGTIPSTGANIGETGFSGIPAVFFTAVGGTLPSALTANVVYYIAYSTANATFSVYDTLAHANAGGGTGQLDIATGAAGTQYYNTFWVVGTNSGAYAPIATATMTFAPTALNLPTFEISQTLAEVGENIIVGCKSSTIYPWNQTDVRPSTIINLPEANVQSLLTVNQMVYIFAGYKGNIYITDGSTASLVLKTPDYCAGVPGTPTTYIEPIYTWGGTAYIRGRVYFSLLDQTATKAGNCGGIWSLVPTQNLYIGQDVGIGLRQENISSYATYSGVATVLIPFVSQSAAKGPQFWSCWMDSYSTATSNFGIDKTATTPVGTTVIETDLIPVGTMLSKYTPKQIEYKLAAPLVAGEIVTMSWRKNATDAWTSGGTAITEGSTGISGYFTANFQGAQWVQLQFVLTPQSSTNASFVRFSQAIMR